MDFIPREHQSAFGYRRVVSVYKRLYTFVTNLDRHTCEESLVATVREIRAIRHRDALRQGNEETEEFRQAGTSYTPCFLDGDTRPELQAKGICLLFQSTEKRTEKQKKGAGIPFKEHPDIQTAYGLPYSLRTIFAKTPSRMSHSPWPDGIIK